MKTVRLNVWFFDTDTDMTTGAVTVKATGRTEPVYINTKNVIMMKEVSGQPFKTLLWMNGLSDALSIAESPEEVLLTTIADEI